MKPVKVNRYVAGKRPKYAPQSDDENEDSPKIVKDENKEVVVPLKTNVDNRRLKRLEEFEKESSERPSRSRHIHEPIILKEQEKSDEDDEDEDVVDDDDMDIEPVEENENSEDVENEEVDEEERIKRRMELKKKALQRQEELLSREEEKVANAEYSESEEESEYEEDEETDSEDLIAPRLKPVFVRKQDRVTVQEKESQLEKEKEIELEKELTREENKKEIKKIIQEEVARDKLSERDTDDNILCDFKTDDENDENEYDAWKLRELKRIKRNKEERENMENEKQEIQKIRNMTEQEREKYFKHNPKLVVNKPVEKGKYKFLQKYYHRGAFYMDKDEDVFKRNYAEPTLEDKFDKSILPKVMQVKNFGMAGRTKYTHLADQDTTKKGENPWENQHDYIVGKGGGTKQVFDKPTAKKRK